MYLSSDSYTKREENKLIKKPIDMNYMCDIMNFIYTSAEISSALEKKNDAILQNDWSISWFKDDHTNEEVFKHVILNTKEFKRKINQFLIEMVTMLKIFGFAGFFYVKDIVKWVSKNPKRYFDELPFGIIPLLPITDQYNFTTTQYSTLNQSQNIGSSLYGQYYQIHDTRNLDTNIIFECSSKYHKKRYEFRVFTSKVKPQFVTLYDALCNSNGNNKRRRGGNGGNPINKFMSDRCGSINEDSLCNGNGNINSYIVPTSKFIDLYKQKSRIEEADTDENDLNFLLTHPLIFLTQKPLEGPQLENISEEVAYTSDTLFQGKTDESLRRRLSTQLQVLNLLYSNAMNQSSNSMDRRPEDLLRYQRQEKFLRPDWSEGFVPLPENMNIQHSVTSPTSIIKVHEKQMIYEREVCSVIGIPFIFYKIDGVSGSSSSSNLHSSHSFNKETLALYEDILHQDVKKQLDVMSDLFSLVYNETYYKLDLLVFDDLIEMIQDKNEILNQKLTENDEMYIDRTLLDKQLTKRDDYKNIDNDKRKIRSIVEDAQKIVSRNRVRLVFEDYAKKKLSNSKI